MSRSTWWRARAALIVAGSTLAVLCAATLLLLVQDQVRLGLVLVALIVLAGAALAFAGFLLTRHFRALETVRGLAVTLRGRGPEAAPGPLGTTANDEAGRMRNAILELTALWRAERSAPDDRLEAVLGAVGEAIVVVTDQGQVSLVNGLAMAALGAHEIEVGTSVFAALRRVSLVAAMERARATAAPVTAQLELLTGETFEATVVDLHDHGGAVLCFTAPEAVQVHLRRLDHDLSLHDTPPTPEPVSDDTRLDALPVVVLDTETTGLDVNRDRIVSVGAVRLHGTRVYRAAVLDELVNPGVPIAARSVAIHGITGAMVAEAPAFADMLPALEELIDGVVVVGHNIAFDLAMLDRECALATVEWRAPPALDTLLLAAALDKDARDLNLEAVAERAGVDVHGRHTALGDSLVTAEVYLSLLPRLAEHGITTLGEARAFAQSAKHVVAQQAAAGW
jgi:DNA polymerase-3 subunit epsilon